MTTYFQLFGVNGAPKLSYAHNTPTKNWLINQYKLFASKVRRPSRKLNKPGIGSVSVGKKIARLYRKKLHLPQLQVQSFISKFPWRWTMTYIPDRSWSYKQV